MKLAEAYVDITARTGKLRGALSMVKKNLGNVLRTAKRMAIGIAAAFAAVTYAAWRFAKAAMVQERAEMLLDSTLKHTGQSVEEYGKKLRMTASAMQKVTIFGDEFILGIMRAGMNLGVTADKISDVTKLAIGLGTSLDMDLNTAMRYAALATKGEMTMLRRYIPELRTVTDATEQWAIVQRMGNAGWEQAQDEAKTTSGALKQMWNVLGDVSERIGVHLLPMIKKITKAITNSKSAIREFVTNALRWLWNNTIKVISRVVFEFKNFSSGVNLAMDLAKHYLSVFAADAKHLFIVQLPEIVQYGLELIGAASKKIGKDTWLGIKAIANDAKRSMGIISDTEWAANMQRYVDEAGAANTTANIVLNLTKRRVSAEEKAEKESLDARLRARKAAFNEYFKDTWSAYLWTKNLEDKNTEDATKGANIRMDLTKKEADEKRKAVFIGLEQAWKQLQVAAMGTKVKPVIAGSSVSDKTQEQQLAKQKESVNIEKKMLTNLEWIKKLAEGPAPAPLG